MKSIKIEDDKLKNLNIERDDELMLTAHVKNHTIYEKLVVDKGAWDVASRLVLKNGAKLSVEGVMFWAVDRASRNLTHLVQMMNDLDSKNSL